MTSSKATPVARQLVEWALPLRLGDIDAAVLERVKLHFLDQLGAQVSCVGLPTCVIAQEYVSRFGRPGVASILGTAMRVDAEDAGFANGTSGSAFEIDDYGGAGANSHPGCAVVPAALAVGESVGASGAQVLRASAVGFETVIRLALASMPSLLLERGFHHTSTLGVFAAALESAMLEGDNVDTAVQAMAVAGSFAGGTTEFARSGGEIKRVHAGMAVAGGLRAARLARLGLTGPATILEGKKGFLQAFCNAHEPAHIAEALGSHWHFPERASIKLFASCALMQPHFAAFDKIKARHAFSAHDVEQVVLGCDPLAFVHTGSTGPRPKDVLGAQFSAEYGVAMRIVKGRNDVGTYLDLQAGGFRDPEVLAVSERIRMEQDPECTFERPLGKVTLRLKDGRVLADSAFAPGSPDSPVTREEIQRKYLDMVAHDWGDAVARRSLDMVMHLEEIDDIKDLTRLFESRPRGETR